MALPPKGKPAGKGKKPTPKVPTNRPSVPPAKNTGAKPTAAKNGQGRPVPPAGKNGAPRPATAPPGAAQPAKPAAPKQGPKVPAPYPVQRSFKKKK